MYILTTLNPTCLRSRMLPVRMRTLHVRCARVRAKCVRMRTRAARERARAHRLTQEFAQSPAYCTAQQQLLHKLGLVIPEIEAKFRALLEQCESARVDPGSGAPSQPDPNVLRQQLLPLLDELQRALGAYHWILRSGRGETDDMQLLSIIDRACEEAAALSAEVERLEAERYPLLRRLRTLEMQLARFIAAM